MFAYLYLYEPSKKARLFQKVEENIAPIETT